MTELSVLLTDPFTCSRRMIKQQDPLFSHFLLLLLYGSEQHVTAIYSL